MRTKGKLGIAHVLMFRCADLLYIKRVAEWIAVMLLYIWFRCPWFSVDCSIACCMIRPHQETPVGKLLIHMLPCLCVGVYDKSRGGLHGVWDMARGVLYFLTRCTKGIWSHGPACLCRGFFQWAATSDSAGGQWHVERNELSTRIFRRSSTQLPCARAPWLASNFFQGLFQVSTCRWVGELQERGCFLCLEVDLLSSNLLSAPYQWCDPILLHRRVVRACKVGRSLIWDFRLISYNRYSLINARSHLLEHKRKLAILRLDGDMYESTMDELFLMYDLVSVGGFVIIDDWNIAECQKAVLQFLAIHGMSDSTVFIPIDGNAVYFRKTAEVLVKTAWYLSFNATRGSEFWCAWFPSAWRH